MGTTLKVQLSESSIRKAISELHKYKDALNDKQTLFAERLAERGITVAREHSKDVGGIFGTHRMGQFVTFEKRVEVDGSTCKGLLIGMGDEVYSKISQGRSINALMALEFGTAGLAIDSWKGSNSESGHENDLVWYAKVEADDYYQTGKWYYKLLSAIRPTRPLYEAAMKMRMDIVEVAQEVFATDRTVSC